MEKDIENCSATPDHSDSEKQPKLNVSVTTVTSHGIDELKALEASEKLQVEGLELFTESQAISKEEIEELNYKVMRKIDNHVVPLLCVTYTLQFLDRLSLNYAAAYSFKDDLGLTGQRYSWVASVFNFGYIAGSIPANYLIQKYPVAKFTGICIFTWSIILLGHLGATNYGGILILRFLLGIMESCISPSCMNICAAFYKKSEQPLRMCGFLSFNGMATMVGALLSYGLGHATHAAIKPWKLIFLTVGLLNFVWSLVFLYLCPSTPADAKFLSEKEKAVAVERVAHNFMGIKNKKLKKEQVIEAFTDYRILIYCLLGVGNGIINGGILNFQSALVKGFGFSAINTTILQLPTGAFEFVIVLITGFLAIYRENLRCILFLVTCIPGFAGLIGIKVIPLEHKWALVGCTWLQYIIGAPAILMWIFMNANVAGQTKRTLSNGLWFMCYAGGSIGGANVFKTNEAPKYNMAMEALITSYTGIMVLIIIYGITCIMENRRRDKKYGRVEGETEQEAIINGFKDMTDKQNTGFRYVY